MYLELEDNHMVTLRDILGLMEPYQHVVIYIDITTDDGFETYY